MPPRHPTAGQASAEYVAVLAVLVVVFGGAGLLVAPPALGERLAGAIRTGICLVGGDICRDRDARAAGLSPCTVREREKSTGVTATIAFLDLGGGDRWTVARRSDGSVLLSAGSEEHGGVSGGLGVELSPLGVHLAADGAAGASFTSGESWLLPDEAAAGRVIARLRSGRLPPPATWRFTEGGAQGEAGLGAEMVEARVMVTLGRRTGQGATTWYLGGRVETAAFGPLGVEAQELSAEGVILERTHDRRGPRELVFRTVDRLGGGRSVELSGRLDLRDPTNRAVAGELLHPRLPSPPAVARDLRAVVQRTAEAGTIERSVYAVEESDRGVELAGRLGIGLGLKVRRRGVLRRLVAASAWTGGDGRERRRVDCVGDVGPA